MGDSGALLLGFTLAAVSVQGLSKTAALTALVLPLLVLAVPLIDTSFVVAKRIKHGKPVYVADRTHLHHRFENIGFSQRRSVVYLYALVRDARARRARDAVRPPARRTATGTRLDVAIDAADRPARDRRLGLRRLPARDRQARESVHPAPREASASRRAPERTKSSEKRLNRPFCAVTKSPHRSAPLRYAAARWSRPSPARFPLRRRARSSSRSPCSASPLGTLIGWLAGALKIGLIIGAVVGIPAGISGVYIRYHEYFA